MITKRIAENFWIEPGSMRDFDALARFHYKARRPATSSRILRIVDRAPTVVGRFIRRSVAGSPVGVLVESYPVLECRMRDLVLHNRYRDMERRARAVILNHEMRTISRVVIDPRYRGLGLAVTLVRHLLDRAETSYIEALAAMGRVHPFFERAGMTRYDPPPRRETERISDALQRLGLSIDDLTSIDRALRVISDHREYDRRWIESELRRFCDCRNCRSRRRKSNGLPREPRPQNAARGSLRDLLATARMLIRSEPVYYLWFRSESHPGKSA